MSHEQDGGPKHGFQVGKIFTIYQLLLSNDLQKPYFILHYCRLLLIVSLAQFMDETFKVSVFVRPTSLSAMPSHIEMKVHSVLYPIFYGFTDTTKKQGCGPSARNVFITFVHPSDLSIDVENLKLMPIGAGSYTIRDKRQKKDTGADGPPDPLGECLR